MPTLRKSATTGASLVVLSSFFYATYGVWSRLMGDAFGSYQQALIRSFIVVSLMLPITVYRKELSKVYWRRDAKWFALSVTSSALVAGPLYYAMLRAGMGLTIALAYAGIVLGMFFFGWVFSRERYTARKFLATALSFVGLACIFAPSMHGIGVLPLIAALGSGFASGLNVVVSQKMPYSASQTTVIAWTGGILANVAMLYITNEVHHQLHFGIEWLYVVLFGLTSIVASWTVIRGVKLIDAGSAGILGLLEIVFGVVFGVVFFAERPDPLAYAGMAVVIIAATVPYLDQLKVRTMNLKRNKRTKHA